jgi:purine-binding chemotaxis protein CheW
MQSNPAREIAKQGNDVGRGPAIAAIQTDQRAGKYLTFQLGKEEFAMQVVRVREILRVQEITAVPHTPDYLKGVMNLRGQVVPVLDLRVKLGIQEQEYTQRTCIIVVQNDSESHHRVAGVIVDAVSEIVNLQASEIENTPDFGGGVATPYLLGMAKIKGRVKILLDIDVVLAAEDMPGLASG